MKQESREDPLDNWVVNIQREIVKVSTKGLQALMGFPPASYITTSVTLPWPLISLPHQCGAIILPSEACSPPTTLGHYKQPLLSFTNRTFQHFDGLSAEALVLYMEHGIKNWPVCRSDLWNGSSWPFVHWYFCTLESTRHNIEGPQKQISESFAKIMDLITETPAFKRQ